MIDSSAYVAALCCCCCALLLLLFRQQTMKHAKVVQQVENKHSHACCSTHLGDPSVRGVTKGSDNTPAFAVYCTVYSCVQPVQNARDLFMLAAGCTTAEVLVDWYAS